MAILLQIVYFHESNAGGIVYTTYNGGVATYWQVCYDCRLPAVVWSVAAGDDVTHLVGGDDPADYRRSPIIVRGNQSPCAIVQFQGGISQRIGNIKWRRTELGTNGPQNHSLWLSPLNNKTANHHVVASLHKAASANVA